MTCINPRQLPKPRITVSAASPLWSLTASSQAAVLAAVRMSMSCVLLSDRREFVACRCEQEVARVSRRPGIRGFSVSERAARLRLKARNQLFKPRLVPRLLSFQKLLQLVAVKAHNNLSVNHGDRGRHVTKLLQFVQLCFVAANVSIHAFNLVL